MRILLFNFLLLLFFILPQGVSAGGLDTKRSLRIDLRITPAGDSAQYELRSVWTENSGGTGLFEGTNPEYGQFRYTLYSLSTGNILYQDGFSSLYEEWLQSDIEDKQPIDFEHPLSVPLPGEAVRFVLERRNRGGNLDIVLNSEINCQMVPALSTKLKPSVKKIVNNGPAHKKVDVVIVAEGYTAGEKAKFDSDASRFTEYFFGTAPFSEHKSSFNVNSVFIASQESGCITPQKNLYPKTVLGSSFNTFGSERYLETLNAFTLGDYVSQVAHDLIVVLVNTGEYGGGGVFNYFAIGSAHHEQSMAVMIHEIGHTFAGLGDEYYDSEVPYSTLFPLDVEPWEPNITTKVNFESKWKDLMGQDGIGLVEGAGYSAKGIFRSNEKCLMKMLKDPFCKVCQAAIVQRIKLLSN